MTPARLQSTYVKMKSKGAPEVGPVTVPFATVCRGQTPVHQQLATGGLVSDPSSSALVRMAADDGKVTPVVAIRGSATAIAVDADFIYWLEDSTLYYAPR
jgi:hypothetical protein